MIESSRAPQIILASASPRRCQLLDQIGVRFLQKAVEIDEEHRPGEPARAYVQRLALEKARAARRQTSSGGGLPVLGADTAVVIDERPLGKPRDRADAIAMLQRLSGRTHRVLSAVALLAEQEQLAMSETRVRFRPLEAAEIEKYWASGEPVDKAGAYAIQGRAAMFIDRIEGSYTGVVGLPVFETVSLLRAVGLDVWD